jgi:DNA adenine methylase
MLECAERLRGVAVECLPAVKVIERYGVASSVIYCDPTYVASTRSGRRKRPDGDYLHEMSDDDHRELAEALHRTPATVLLSGYRSDLYDEVYGDFDSLSVGIDRPSSRGSATGVSGAVETIWSNRPIGARAVTELAV